MSAGCDGWEAAAREADELARQEQELAARIEAEARAWKQKWPHHCTACGGHGGGTFRQGHPYGMGTAYEELWDPCEEGEPTKCHRCGEHGLTADGDGPCAKCGCYDDGCPEY
jgi:hypothetical protein